MRFEEEEVLKKIPMKESFSPQMLRAGFDLVEMSERQYGDGNID